MHHITITLITYQRPALLKKTLEHLIKINIPDGTSVDIAVVDNDEAFSAREVVEAAMKESPIPIHYHVEPRKGRAHARNKALQVTSQSDYLASLDDDIVVEADWLVHLYETIRSYGAQFVSGKLHLSLPENCPNWAKNCRLFKSPAVKTGELLETAGAGNLLIDRQCEAVRELQYSPRWSREDVVFSLRARWRGATIIFCEHEDARHAMLSQERLTLRWVMKRAMCNGAVRSDMLKEHRVWPSVLAISVSRSMQMSYYAAGAFLLALVGRRPWIRSLEHASMAVGWLVGIVGNNSLREMDS